MRRVEARSSLYRLPCCALALAAVLVAASGCGGRWRTITTTPDDDSSDSGGSVGVSGASSSHAGHGGATGQAGGTGQGGSGVAGADNCDLGCPDLVCPSGSTLAFVVGQCCQVCQPVCKQLCPACGQGTKPQMSGGCCPDCVPVLSCEAGRMNYQDVRTTASYKFSYGCSSDADCAVVAPVNQCEAGCIGTPIPKDTVDTFTEYLKNEAEQDCAACKEGPVPPCVAPAAAHCYAGQCAFTQP